MFSRLLIVLLIQIAINYICQMFIPTDSIYGIIAYSLATSFLIAFFFAFLNTPREFRKDFYKHPGFHKFMLTYFLVFLGVDFIFYLCNL